MLALSGESPLVEGSEDADGGHGPGRDVRDRRAALGRWPVRIPRDLHDAGHSLGHYVVAEIVLQRTVRAEGGDGTVDDVRMDHAQVLVPETEAFCYPRAEVLDDDICPAR